MFCGSWIEHGFTRAAEQAEVSVPMSLIPKQVALESVEEWILQVEEG